MASLLGRVPTLKVVGDFFIEVHVVGDDLAAGGEEVVEVAEALAVPVFDAVEVEDLDVGGDGLEVGVDGAGHAEVDDMGAFFEVEEGGVGGGEDVAVGVGGTDDVVDIGEAVFDLVEADELDFASPLGVELGLVAVVAPDGFGVGFDAFFYEAFAEESGADDHDVLGLVVFGGEVS